MIYKARYLEPKNKAIDPSIDNEFRWQSQGEPQTDFRLKIYKLPNELKYDSTKITTGDNFHVVPGSSLESDSEYKWSVITYGASGDVESNSVYLKTNANPTVTLTIPGTLTVQRYSVVANYAQSEGISLKQYKFILYDINDEILKETEWKFDYSMEYTIDGLMTGSTYKLECIAEAQNGLRGTSGKQTFDVLYEKPDATRTIKVTPDNKCGIMNVSWDNLKQVTPIVTGNYSYVEGAFEKGLLLDDGAYITYEEETNEDFTIQFYRRYPILFEGAMISMYEETGDPEPTFEFGYSNGRFYINNMDSIYESEIVDMSNIIEDIEDWSIAKTELKYPTIGDIVLPMLSTFIFFQVTFTSVIVKRNNKIIATIFMD